MRPTRPLFKRGIDSWTVLRPVTVQGKTLVRGDVFTRDQVRFHVLNMFYSRRRISPTGNPWTELQLWLIACREADAQGEPRPELPKSLEGMAGVPVLSLATVVSGGTDDLDALELDQATFVSVEPEPEKPEPTAKKTLSRKK